MTKINKSELRKNTRVWCCWMHRYLWFKEEMENMYKFEDAGDCVFVFKKDELEKLEIR